MERKRNQWEGKDASNHSTSNLIERLAKYKADNNDYKYKRSGSLLTDGNLLSRESFIKYNFTIKTIINILNKSE